MKNLFVIFLFAGLTCKGQGTVRELQDKRIPVEFYKYILKLDKKDTSKFQDSKFKVESGDNYTQYFFRYSVSSKGTLKGSYIAQEFERVRIKSLKEFEMINEFKYIIAIDKIVVKCDTHAGKHECGLFDTACQKAFEKEFQCSKWYPSN